jgi:SAM-dependent methyltransferase
MSRLSALFFARVQAAPFYQALHEEAVALLPIGRGQVWLDMGCGPGLLSRLAHRRGYRVTGVDADPAMVRQARHLAPEGPRFEVGRLGEAGRGPGAAEVVSAASLLAVLPDRPEALRDLVRLLRPGGTLLLIEPSPLMSPQSVRQYLAGRPRLRDAWVLRLWARSRNPARLVQAGDLAVPGFTLAQHPLLGGLVNAWLLTARPAGLKLVERAL